MKGRIIPVAVEDGGGQDSVTAFAGFWISAAQSNKKLPTGDGDEIVMLWPERIERNGSFRTPCEVDCLALHGWKHRALGIALMGGSRNGPDFQMCDRLRLQGDRGVRTLPAPLCPSSVPEADYGKTGIGGHAAARVLVQ